MESPPGVSLFKGQDGGNMPVRNHKVLLSYNSNDKILNLPPVWTYPKFLDEVSKLFPELKKSFYLMDSDFKQLNKSSYEEMKTAHSLETWLLVCDDAIKEENNSSLNETYYLEKPRYELLKYDVHPNALTQSGNYHFSSPYQAFCEFIDNAVQATMNNTKKRVVDLHLFLKQRIACIMDNGEGMTSEGMKAFASYFLSQKDRGLEKEPSPTYGYIDGNISKFGVGATQAGFYLGDIIKVISKRRNSPFVTEIAISKKELHKRARLNLPVFEDYKCIRSPGDQSTLDKTERECISTLIEKEEGCSNFTMILIKDLQDHHITSMQEDNCEDLIKNLAHVYHYYLHGIQGSLKKLSFHRIQLDGLRESHLQNVSMNVYVDKGNGNPAKLYRLNEVKNDLQSLYQERSKSVFSFCLDLNIPEVETPQVVQGCLLYFANESGEETVPTTDTIYGDNNTLHPMFECFWQGRLAPLSYVNRLEFCMKPENRTRKQRDLLPDMCFKRVRGLLFFNRNTPVSNNKLKILLDTRRDLSDALSEASSSRRLPKEFQSWLEQCHQEYDRELVYAHPLPDVQQPNNGDKFYAQLTLVTSAGKEMIYKSGETVKIDTRPVAYGRVMYFTKKYKSNEVGSINYIHLPEEIYGASIEEKPVMRIAGKPEQGTLNKVFATELLHLPTSVKVFEGDNRIEEVTSNLIFRTGEAMKEHTAFWVEVFNGERPPKKINEVYQQKVAVEVKITGRNPLVNGTPVDKIDRRYGFKSFYLDKVGDYDVQFTVLLANKPMKVSKTIKIKMLPNVADIVNLHENNPEYVPLGEKCISFTLSFHDVFENNTCLFREDKKMVALSCSCDNMKIKGVKESYKPDNQGLLKVTGLSVEPLAGHNISLSRDYQFWVVAEGIGDVMFPFHVVTGPPEKVLTTQLDNLTFENYENFPEFEVKLLDKWNQPSVIPQKTYQLAMSCDVFATSTLFSSISSSKGKFSSTPIKVTKMKQKITANVNISLVLPETSKKKMIVKEVIKTLHTFQINVTPSNACQQIRIIQVQNTVTSFNKNKDSLSLQAVAGSVVTGLKLIGFGVNGKQLSDEEFLSQDLNVTTTWAEVNSMKLPFLPDCPVTNIIQENVQNVQCFCKWNGFEIRNEAKLRISVVAGVPKKWSFQPLSLKVKCDKKKDLCDAVKIVVLDQHHNTSLPTDDLLPIITTEHAEKDKKVEFTGSIILRHGEFLFTPASILRGHAGQVSLHISDENNVLSRDSVSVELDSGAPSKLLLSCTSFDEEVENKYQLNMLSKASLSNYLIVNISDEYGNHVPLKTPINLEWFPPDAGKSITKRSNAHGSVGFQGNQVKCLAQSGRVKIKVNAPDIKSIKPTHIDVNVLQCNRVTKLIISISEQKLTVNDNLPIIKITHETEDNLQVPDFKKHISITLSKPNGENISIAQYYPVSSREMQDDGVLICTPQKESKFIIAGSWRLSCRFTESRKNIKEIVGNAIFTCDPYVFNVEPGKAVKLDSDLDTHTILSASSTADMNGRTLVPIKTQRGTRHLCLYATDEHNNTTPLKGNINVSIEPVNPDDSTIILPKLEASCTSIQKKDLIVTVPRLTLKEKIGNKMGYYYLVFTEKSVKPLKIKFTFSTNAEYEKISKELAPLQAELQHLRFLHQQKCDEFANIKKQFHVMSKSIKEFTNILTLPTIQQIDVELAKIRNNSYAFERRQQHIRQCRQDAHQPSQNIRQYIKGLVCELAYVSDDNLCRILSWYAQSKMRVALCETKEQQRRVYDMGYPAYSENLIMGFQKRGFNARTSDLLPIDLPKAPADFQSSIDCAVNLLEFKDGCNNLRSSLFYSVFSRTIVVKDLDHAQKYREHVVKQRQPCPAILTLNGDLIASDGLMDPSRRCPNNINQLKYSFGELPPMERRDYQNVQSDLRNLEELRQVAFDVNIKDQEVKQAFKDFKDKETKYAPKLKELEKQRESLKRVNQDLLFSPNSKRTKR